MPRYAAVTGWGHYVPERVLTNRELERMVDTSDEWIRTRTGIAERRVAAADETTTAMCVRAARAALGRARLGPIDLDLVICATTTPDNLIPATACTVQEQLGAVNAGAFDLNAACTGFLAALITGSQFIQAGTYERVLVVAGETFTRFLDWSDRSTCILFGDGAGAVLLEATDEPCGLLSSVLGSLGAGGHLLTISGQAVGDERDGSHAVGYRRFTMQGNETFKFAVRSMAQAAAEALAKANLSTHEVRKVVPHQANVRILKATQEALGIPWESLYVNVDRYGNTSAASIAIALSEFLDAEPVHPGDNLLFVAFGGGLAWGAAVVRWADVAALVAAREEGPLAI